MGHLAHQPRPERAQTLAVYAYDPDGYLLASDEYLEYLKSAG